MRSRVVRVGGGPFGLLERERKGQGVCERADGERVAWDQDGGSAAAGAIRWAQPVHVDVQHTVQRQRLGQCDIAPPNPQNSVGSPPSSYTVPRIRCSWERTGCSAGI